MQQRTSDGMPPQQRCSCGRQWLLPTTASLVLSRPMKALRCQHSTIAPGGRLTTIRRWQPTWLPAHHAYQQHSRTSSCCGPGCCQVDCLWHLPLQHQHTHARQLASRQHFTLQEQHCHQQHIHTVSTKQHLGPDVAEIHSQADLSPTQSYMAIKYRPRSQATSMHVSCAIEH